MISCWKKEFLSNAAKVLETGNQEEEHRKTLEKEKEILVQQIGQLTVDIN